MRRAAHLTGPKHDRFIEQAALFEIGDERGDTLIGHTGVFGVVLLLIATTIWTPLSAGRGLILIFLLLLTGPVTSHAVSSAAYRLKVPLRQAIRDDLANKTP